MQKTIGSHCCAVLFLALSAASAGLPAPRVLPGQTLHLDTTQVSLVCLRFCMNLSLVFPTFSISCAVGMMQLDVSDLFSVWAMQQQKNYTAEVCIRSVECADMVYIHIASMQAAMCFAGACNTASNFYK